MGKGTLHFNLHNLGFQELSRVHQTGKDDVVLLRDIAQFLLCLRKDQDGIAVELVILSLQAQRVTDFYLRQNAFIREIP